MDFLYFLIWLVVGLSAAFALFWLGMLFASLKKTIELITNEVIPVIKELEKTIENINSELERVETAFKKVEEISGKLKSGIQQVEVLVAPGLTRILSFANAIKNAASIIMKGKK
ncbi:MAG: hypothetical protein N2440_00080 [Actinobacteria bacterium]|nr:hypothetical protein [Actinomycetota bacterium]